MQHFTVTKTALCCKKSADYSKRKATENWTRTKKTAAPANVHGSDQVNTKNEAHGRPEWARRRVIVTRTATDRWTLIVEITSWLRLAFYQHLRLANSSAINHIWTWNFSKQHSFFPNERKMINLALIKCSPIIN